MQIKHVEELVGITRKNIRFYEDQGLLSPRRADNGYREYHEEEIKRLKQIKILRKLSIPIEEIKRVFDGECSLDVFGPPSGGIRASKEKSGANARIKPSAD